MGKAVGTLVEVIEHAQGGVRVAFRRKSSSTASASRKNRHHVRTLQNTYYGVLCFAYVVRSVVFKLVLCTSRTSGSEWLNMLSKVLLASLLCRGQDARFHCC